MELVFVETSQEGIKCTKTKRVPIRSYCSNLYTVNQGQGSEDNCSKNHGVGFSRKSVSFCQRDNVHVYDRVQEYENDEIDNSSNSNNATSDKSVSNGKNSSLYKMCIYVCQKVIYPKYSKD